MATTARWYRKAFSAFVAFVLAVSLSPTSAYAEDGVDAGEATDEGISLTASNSSDVAQIGSKTYATLSKAFDAVKTGETIKLLSDCSNGYVNVEKSCTLDLNGHTLTRSGWAGFYPYSFYIQDNIAFTITDSSASGTGKLSTEKAVQLEDGGASFTLNGGTIKADVAVKFIDSNQTFTMNGGTIEATEYGVWVNNTYDAFTLNGGTIKSNKYGVYVNDRQCTVTMNGGTIDTKDNAVQFQDGGEGWDPSVFSMKDGVIKSQKRGINFENFSSGNCVYSVFDGGTIETVQACLYKNGYGSFRINGGSFTSTNYACIGTWTDGETGSFSGEILGGTFKSADNYKDLVFWLEDGTSYTKRNDRVFAKAGTFSKKPDNIFIWNYVKAYQNEDGTWTLRDRYDEVSFDANGGTLAEGTVTQSIEHFGYATKPDDPTRDGYTFLGWAEKESSSKYFDFATSYIYMDITLYAQWAKIVCQIEETGAYYSTLPEAIEAAESGQTIKLYDDVSRKSNMSVQDKAVTLDLNGHTVSFSRGNLQVSDGAGLTIKDSSATETEVGTGKIQATGVNYAVRVTGSAASFKLESGTLESTSTALYVDSAATEATTAVEIAGGTVVGANNGAVSVKGTNAQLIISGGTLSTNATYDVSVAEGNSLAVSGGRFEVEGDEVDRNISSAMTGFVTGGVFTKPVPQEQCASGYSPVTNPDGTYGVAKSAHTVTFDANGGVLTSEDTQTVESGKAVAEPSSPTRDGYDFTGWFTEASGGAKYDFSAAVTSDFILYAQWEAQPVPVTTHVVTFDANGGSYATGKILTEEVENGKTATEPTESQRPTRDNYTFAGWASDEAGEQAFDFSMPITNSITIYAQWTANPVAQIGSTTYTTLKAAVDAAQAGDEIALLTDIELDSVVSASAKDFTLDLAGHVITATKELDETSYLFYLNGGSFALKDSSAGGTGAISATSFVIAALEPTSLTIESGTIGAYIPLMVENHSDTASKVTVAGGTLTANEYDIDIFAALNLYGNIDAAVTGGTLTGASAITFDSDTTLSVQGGTFASRDGEADIDAFDGSTGFVSGGTFSKAVPFEQCAAGYVPVTNESTPTTYSVAKGAALSFDANGGTLSGDAVVYVLEGNVTVAPDVPVRDGYQFAGWHTAAEGGDAFEFGSALTENTTLYAHWLQKVEKPTLTPATGLVYDGTTQTGATVSEGTGYTLRDAQQINAGDYTATVALSEGYVWADGTTDDLTCTYSIAKRPVTFTIYDAQIMVGDPEPDYDGKVEGVLDGDDLNAKPKLEEGADITKPGKYQVSATYDNNNYDLTVVPGTLTVVAAVASVTHDGVTTSYASLADAFAAALDGDTVALLEDVTLDEPVKVAASVTLDLRGKTVTSNGENAFEVVSGALTVTDTNDGQPGSVVGTDPVNATIVVCPGASFELAEGTIQGVSNTIAVQSAAGNPAKANISGGNVVATADVAIEAFGEGAQLTVTGGSISAATKAGIVLGGETASLTVTGGTVTGPYAVEAYNASNTLSVSGGTFTGAKEADMNVPDGTAGFVSGGLFAHAVPAAQCAEGYVPVQNDDGTYGVVKGYQVTFDAHGGTIEGESGMAVVVAAGKTVAEPSEPVRSGYDFRAWTTDEQGEDVFSFATPITADVTLYAQWTKKVEPVTEYTVTLDANGGVLSGEATQKVTAGEKAAKPEDPTRDGYTFKGWTTDAAGEDAFDFANTAIVKDLTLYAQWDKVPEPVVTTYTVTLDANGGTLAGAAQETVEEGSCATEPVDPFREGWKFTGWFTAAEGGSAFDFAATPITEDVTLYAQWVQGVDPEVFEVTADAHGGAFADGSSTQTLWAESGTVLQGLEQPAREGYDFRAWTLDAAGEGVFDPATDVVTTEFTLYAQWTKTPEPVVTYQVTFDANGGAIEGESGMAVQVEAGKSVVQPADPVRDGYTFKGWFSAAEGGNAYDFSAVVEGDITLFAQWQKEEDPTPPTPTPDPDPQPTPDPGVNPGSDSGNTGGNGSGSIAATGDTTLPVAAVAGGCVIVAGVAAAFALRKRRR